MNISPHFTFAEVTFSQEATRKGIDNSLPESLVRNAIRQSQLMEFVRTILDKPVMITSWYRCPEVNKAIGGSETSMHRLALACDFVSPFGTPYEICEEIMKNQWIKFDQLIHEFGRWVHIGLSEGPQRGQVLTATKEGGRTVYLPGLHKV